LIEGHAQALRETLRPVIRRALWLEGLWLGITITIHVVNHGKDTFLYVLAGAAMLGMLVPDVRALTWTAMWRSVIAKNARTAQQEAFSNLAGLPWLALLFGLFVCCSA